MNSREKMSPRGHIIFDHDGTLVNTDRSPYHLFNGMHELLSYLTAAQFHLYIWTARPRRSVLEITRKLDILPFFTELYCSDDGESKPNPVGLKELVGDIPKNQILHIGDSITDLDGAHAFGIEVVAACWNNPDQVNKYKRIADYTASDLVQLQEIIRGKFYV